MSSSGRRLNPSGGGDSAKHAGNDGYSVGVHAVKEILDEVSANEKYIRACNNKKVIVFIGVTKVGKSTTIDALLSPPLISVSDNKTGSYSFATKDGKPLASEIGTGSEGLSCTVYPRAYPYEGDTVLLDTRGFYDTGASLVKEGAAHILLEMALKMAKEVELVFVINATDFEGGFDKLDKVVEVVSRVVSDTGDVPALLLLVNYQPNMANPASFEIAGKIMAAVALKSSEKKCEEEMKKVSDEFCSLMDRQKRVLYEAARTEKDKADSLMQKRLTEISKLPYTVEQRSRKVIELQNSPERVSARKKVKFANFIWQNFERRCVMYFDPRSVGSINNLKRFILSGDLPIIKKGESLINFERASDLVTEFMKFVKTSAISLTLYLECKTLLLKYSRPFVDVKTRELHKEREKHQQALDYLRKGIKENDYLIEYTSQFSHSKAESLESINREIERIERDLGVVGDEVRCVKEAPYIMHWEDEWDDLGWRSEHRVKYPEKVPYVKVDVKLGKETEEWAVVSKDSPNFEVVYGVGSHWTRFKNGVKIGFWGIPALLGSEYALDKCGEASDEQKFNEGHVQIYVRKQDLPEQKRGLEIKERRIRYLEEDLEKKRTEKQKFTDANASDLEGMALLSLRKIDSDLAVWGRYFALIDYVSKYKRNLDDFVDFVYGILSRYYSEEDLKKPENDVFRVFIEAKTQCPGTIAESTDSKVDLSSFSTRVKVINDELHVCIESLL